MRFLIQMLLSRNELVAEFWLDLGKRMAGWVRCYDFMNNGTDEWVLSPWEWCAWMDTQDGHDEECMNRPR